MRVKRGDVIRLYGFPGTFVVGAPGLKYDFWVERNGTAMFGAMDASVVEINKKPVPMLSAPIAEPAPDYPHTPQFDYTDGPQSLAEEAMKLWEERRKHNLRSQ